MPVEFVAQPKNVFRLGDFLKKSLEDAKWTDFRAAIAFVKQSGTKHIRGQLAAFVDRGGKACISAGIDTAGTTVEGLRDLLAAMKSTGKLFVFHNANSSTFHPKTYLFKNSTHADLVVGSGNMTEGGLFTNYEASLLLHLDLSNPEHAALLSAVEATLDEWSTQVEGLCYALTAALIDQLASTKQIPDEAFVRAQRKVAAASKPTGVGGSSIFTSHSVPAAPPAIAAAPELAEPSDDDASVLEDEQDAEALTVVTPVAIPAQAGTYQMFVMTLQKTDVGVGQTNTGTQRRSPEIFIPLVCRDYDPNFWGWPSLFVPDGAWTGPIDSHGRGKMDRNGVMIRMGGVVFPVSIWYNPDKRDFRIRSEDIRSAGVIGDILYVERSDGSGGFNYFVEAIPQGTTQHSTYLAMCTKGVRNSKKLWNYI